MARQTDTTRAGSGGARRRGFLSALARDVRGNTLAMMAMFLIPLTGLVGSAVDMSRLYVVKARLQQACDAGALAGRKFMADTNSTTLDTAAAAQAQAFFGNNFKKDTAAAGATPATLGYMNTSLVSFTPAKTTDNQVSGTATATVPMTIAKILGTNSVKLDVVCEARYDVADTDVMFVLDTTGSMACLASQPNGCGAAIQTYTRPDGTTGYYSQEVAGSKLSGVRSAVLNFYDTVAGSADPSTHIRYGFVTYTSTVNAGYAVTGVSSNYMVNNWSYDSRRVVGDQTQGSPTPYGNGTYQLNQATCNAYNGYRTPTSGYSTSGAATVLQTSWTWTNGGTCTVNQQTVSPIWRYEKVPFDVRGYVSGAQVDDPSKITAAKNLWQGCLEERDTTSGTTSFDQNNLPPDLDPDLIPTTDDSTKWRPMWPDVVYYRGGNTSIDYAGNTTNPYGDTTSTTTLGQYTALGAYNNIGYGFVSCGKPVRRLGTMSRTDVSNYVNASDFVPQGGTYHDTGMIWGTRMLSPNGIFASDTSTWAGRNPPNRYIVFMTDGDMAPNAQIYGMYGMEYYDQRVANGDVSNLTDYHNARFLAECQAAKARNITVFVVGFGQSLTPQLTTCASPGQAFYASDNASLNTAFQSIAKQVAMLRVSK